VLDNNTLQFNQQKIWQSYQYLQTKWAKPSRIDEITGSAANTSSCRNFDHRQIQQQKYISAFVSSLLSICKKKKKKYIITVKYILLSSYFMFVDSVFDALV
jgi:acyl-homoserine lactone acylase PvdQ